VSIDTTWPFPATQQEYKPHPEEVKPKKVARKTVATTRKKKA
jgi:hypothetical protein